MASRQTPIYCRVVRSGLGSSSGTVRPQPGAAAGDGVWITDALLASAFERFCRHSQAALSPYSSSHLTRNNNRHSRRFASNVPGPLENRRRLGKRQMTEQLSMQMSNHPLALPAWALPNAPDLRQWQWTAPRDLPSSLSFRQTEQDEGRNDGGLRNAAQEEGTTTSWNATLPLLEVPKWLTNFGKPTTKQEGADDTAEPTIDESILVTSDNSENSSAATAKRRSATSEAFFASLQAWEEAVPQNPNQSENQNQNHHPGAIDDKDFGVQVRKICDEFQIQLRLAALTADEAREAFDTLWTGLQTRFVQHKPSEVVARDTQNAPNTPTARDTEPRDDDCERYRRHRQYAETLYAATLQGIAECRLLHAQDFGESFWRRLLLCATEPPSYQALPATKTLMATLMATPPQFVAQMADLLPAVLRTIFVSSADAYTDVYADVYADDVCGDNQSGDHSPSLATQVAEALKIVDLQLPQNQGLVQATTSQLLGGGQNAACALWMATLARMPQVRQEVLFGALLQVHQHQKNVLQSHTGGQTQTITQTQREAGRWHLSSMDLCSLLLTQWKSRGYATQEVLDSFRAAGYGRTGGTAHADAADTAVAAEAAEAANHMAVTKTRAGVATETAEERATEACDSNAEASALGAAVLAVYYSRFGHQSSIGIYASLWSCLKMLGREAELVDSVEALVAKQVRQTRLASEAREAREAEDAENTKGSTHATSTRTTATVSASTPATADDADADVRAGDVGADATAGASTDAVSEAAAIPAATATAMSTTAMTKRLPKRTAAWLKKALTTQLPPSTFFENLAYGTNDLDAALQLHAIYMQNVRPKYLPTDSGKGGDPNLWSVNSWNRFSDRLRLRLDRGLMTPGQISYVLDMDAHTSIQKKRTRRSRQAAPRAVLREKAGARTVALVNDLAVHFALQPNIGQRQALRGVERCRAYLKAFAAPPISKPRGLKADGHGGEGSGGTQGTGNNHAGSSRTVASPPKAARLMSKTSPTVLRALFHVVTRDLDAVQPGRVTRLQWLVDLVRKDYGDAAALSVARALERWRNVAVKIMRRDDHQRQNLRWAKTLARDVTDMNMPMPPIDRHPNEQ